MDKLGAAFGGAEDITPAEGQPLHVLLTALEMPEPWRPSKARGLTIWRNWPTERPDFYIDYELVDDQGQPPRSNSNAYLVGESWRALEDPGFLGGSDARLSPRASRHAHVVRTTNLSL